MLTKLQKEILIEGIIQEINDLGGNITKLEYGERKNPEYCPIANALSQFCKNVIITYDYAAWTYNNEYYHLNYFDNKWEDQPYGDIHPFRIFIEEFDKGNFPEYELCKLCYKSIKDCICLR